MSIVFFVGKNGASKTAGIVQYGVLPCWSLGRRVVSNISLYPEEVGYPAHLYQPLDEPLCELPRLGRHVRRMCLACRNRVRGSVCRRCGGPVAEVPRIHPEGGLWSITDNEGCGLVLDEITTMFPARDSVSLPPELQALLNQWRKPDIAPVLLSAPAWARADLMIRETCTTVVEATPVLPGLFSKKPSTPWGWPSHRVFRRRWYAAAEYERASESGFHGEPQSYMTRYTWRPKVRRKVFAAYDTNEGVGLADHISCAVCGGKTPRGMCKDKHAHQEAARDLRAHAVEREYPLTPEVLEAAGLIPEAAALDAGQLVPEDGELCDA